MRGFIASAIVLAAFAAAPRAMATTPQDVKTRPKVLNVQATSHNAGLSFNFDEAEVDGKARLPSSTNVTAQAIDNKLDLIHVRLRWTIEMVRSTSNLSPEIATK